MKHRGWCAGAVLGAITLCVSGPAFAGNGSDEADDSLRREVAALRAEVAELRAERGEQWMNEQRAQEIRALVADVLADADTRASLLQGGGGVTYGGFSGYNQYAPYNSGFTVASADGGTTLSTSAQLQTRFLLNSQDSSGDDDRWGFENSRTQLFLGGRVGGDQWSYYVQADFSRNGGGATLKEAYVRYDFGNNWAVRMGQYRAPIQREQNVSSAHQLATERSNVSYIHVPFDDGWMQGVSFQYVADNVRGEIGVNDGLGSGNSPYTDVDTDLAITGRLEFLLNGTFAQFDDFTSPRDTENGALLGFGLHWEEGEDDTAAEDDEAFILSADLSLECGCGGNFFAGLTYSSWEMPGIDRDMFGVVLQGGVYVRDDIELFGRFEYNDFDESGVDDLTIFTAGVNKYCNNNVKWTSDIGYAFDEVNTLGVEGITGWRSDGADEDGQLLIRTQLQLLF